MRAVPSLFQVFYIPLSEILRVISTLVHNHLSFSDDCADRLIKLFQIFDLKILNFGLQRKDVRVKIVSQ